MNIVGVALQAKWDKIALELKITAEEISAIQVNHHGKPDFAQDCMMDTFQKWRNTMTSPYTWHNLAAVLCSVQVNRKDHLEHMYLELSKK